MKSLDPKYQQQLEAIEKELQASAEFATFLDTEEDEDYKALREKFEPQVAELYKQVADDDPMQVLAFEEQLIKMELEGMFLARVLGYSVLRGVIDHQYRYVRPQAHFKSILKSIAGSSNFDYIRKRIGQTIQVGFALSSDIWVTNLINEITNKRVRYFLQSQKLPRFRLAKERKISYLRYANQFRNDEFQTAEFPTTFSELKVLFPEVKKFLKHRIAKKKNNARIMPPIKAFLGNEAFKNSQEYLEMLSLYANFFELNKADMAELSTWLGDARSNMPDFSEKWLDFLLAIHHSELQLDGHADQRVSNLINHSVEDDLSSFYQLTDIIHSKGYLHEETIDAVKTFYVRHEGLSTINECLRQTIFRYFETFLNNLEEADYPEYFELSKIFPVYMDIFNNQFFNQRLKELCLRYVKRLQKRYTDKRGKDYQDIKKFVLTNFQDLGFYTEKEILEMFKTRRKRKATA